MAFSWLSEDTATTFCRTARSAILTDTSLQTPVCLWSCLCLCIVHFPGMCPGTTFSPSPARDSMDLQIHVCHRCSRTAVISSVTSFTPPPLQGSANRGPSQVCPLPTLNSHLVPSVGLLLVLRGPAEGGQQPRQPTKPSLTLGPAQEGSPTLAWGLSLEPALRWRLCPLYSSTSAPGAALTLPRV